MTAQLDVYGRVDMVDSATKKKQIENHTIIRVIVFASHESIVLTTTFVHCSAVPGEPTSRSSRGDSHYSNHAILKRAPAVAIYSNTQERIEKEKCARDNLVMEEDRYNMTDHMVNRIIHQKMWDSN